ncbi:MAG: type I restriction-modification system subunit M [Buchananella hordeovulneris]|nr:type I restriction-modification system subunit M [Buchananella hordeovulneris]
MATTSAAQRQELHKTIWGIANDLRGSVDGWDFKSFVLGMLFYRFISENLSSYLDQRQRSAGVEGYSYAQEQREIPAPMRKMIIDAKGFFIEPADLFENVRARARKPQELHRLNEELARIFNNIEASAIGASSESDLRGLFDDLDVNSPKLGDTVLKRNEKLAGLLDAIGALPLGDPASDESIDLFGDTYEYLMQMYASQAGKSGGEFFTPQEVSDLLARLAVGDKARVESVYDPAAGSGSLLLRFAKALGRENVGMFEGQEINLTTYNLCRINMFLHNISFANFDIQLGDTLLDPKCDENAQFECIVSNPPYSLKWIGKDDPVLIQDERYAPAGVLAPKSAADLAFTMHMLYHLHPKGTAAIVEFPGVLYRGGAERKIRQHLLENNYVEAIIQLPPDLFFGTTIATCIIVLKKSRDTTDVMFVDASKLFTREGNKNRLTEQHRQTILDAVSQRYEEPHFTARVSPEAIAANDYNFSVSAYVEKEDTREKVDIKELNARIAGIVERQSKLRAEIDAIVAELEAEQ